MFWQCFWGLYFPITFFHTLFILFSPLNFSHIFYFILPSCFFLFFASKIHSTFHSSASSVILNDSGFIGSLRISDPDENLFKTPKQKESPLPFVYTLFFHLPGRQYAQKHQAVSDDLKSRELSLISLDAVFHAWLFIRKEWQCHSTGTLFDSKILSVSVCVCVCVCVLPSIHLASDSVAPSVRESH